MAEKSIIAPRGVAETDMASLTQAAQFRRNARDCALLAARAQSKADRARLLTMEKSWIALADNEDWLEGAQKPQQTPRLSQSN